MSFFFLSIALFIGLACGEKSIKHDEILAARRAIEFAEAAFVRQDIERAYSKLSDDSKRYVSNENFRKTLSKLHPKGYPTRIEVIEYELIPMEKRLIYIFLVGERSGVQSYYYRITMEGGSESDYTVLVIKREYHRYPTSPLRKPLRIK